MLQYNVHIESSEAKNLLIPAVADFYGATIGFVEAVDEKLEALARAALESAHRRQIEGSEVLVGDPEFEVGLLDPEVLVDEDPRDHDLEHTHLRFPAF